MISCLFSLIFFSLPAFYLIGSTFFSPVFRTYAWYLPCLIDILVKICILLPTQPWGQDETLHAFTAHLCLHFLKIIWSLRSRSVLSDMVTLDTRSYWTLKMWLVWVEMCFKYKIHAGFQRLSMKKKKYIINNFRVIIFWLCYWFSCGISIENNRWL